MSDGVCGQLGMDLLNRLDCLGDDPSVPQVAVEAGLGEPQERVGECRRDEQAGVRHC